MDLMTVLGPLSPDVVGIVDAHNHAWIAPLPGLPSGPVLDRYELILAELQDFHQAGGATIVDCQPGGCGRDGRVLCQLSTASGVHILTSTEYHLNKYYPPEHWLFQATAQQDCDYFMRELHQGLDETRPDDAPFNHPRRDALVGRLDPTTGDAPTGSLYSTSGDLSSPASPSAMKTGGYAQKDIHQLTCANIAHRLAVHASQ